jgi:hypothetical protein
VSGDLAYHVVAAMLRMILKEEFRYEVYSHDIPMSVVTNNLATPTGVGAGTNPYNSLLYLVNPGFRIDFVYQDYDSDRIDDKERGPSKMDVAFRVYSQHQLSGQASNPPQKTFRYLVREICDKLSDNFIRGTSGTGTANRPNRILHGYYVSIPDVADHTSSGSTFGRVLGYRTLYDRYFKAYSTATMRVQNVSPAADAAALDADRYDGDRIDVVPLLTRCFGFRDCFPKTRHDQIVALQAGSNVGGYTDNSNTLLVNAEDYKVNGYYLAASNAFKLHHDVNNDGIILPDQDLFGHMWQMPNKDFFMNCNGYSDGRIGPGRTKSYSITFQFDGNINKFLHGIVYADTSDAAMKRTYGSLGTSFIVGFEKTMSIQSANLIALNVACTFHAGAYFKRRKPHVLLPMQVDMIRAMYGAPIDSSLKGADKKEVPIEVDNTVEK